MLFVPAVVPAGCLKNVETWPRVASKYLHSPLLFEGCKFDLRYIVLVRSFDPLEVGPEASGVLRLRSCLVHAEYAVLTALRVPCLRQLYVCDVFWIRFSNKPYTLVPSSLDDYETHFTVRVPSVAIPCSLAALRQVINQLLAWFVSRGLRLRQVMNYGRSLRQVGYEAFVPAIEAQYPGLVSLRLATVG